MTERAPPKPEYGDPCNGCGLCCAAELCEVAKMALGDVEPPCPIMAFRDGRFRCRLIDIESLTGMEPLIAQALGIGEGCYVDDDWGTDA